MPRHFPHLLPEDKELWKDWLALNPRRFTHYEYDVKVGFGRDPGSDFPMNIREMALNISRRRIDAIGFNPHDITIIEISVFAGLTQLGQLMAYPTLYKNTTEVTLPIKRLLVARAIQTDIEPVLIKEQIPFEVIPFPEPPPPLTLPLS